MRLAPLPPAWGPVPVVAAPAARTSTVMATRARLSHRGRSPTATRPRPGAWPASRVRTTATANSAMPTMKWVMTT